MFARSLDDLSPEELSRLELKNLKDQRLIANRPATTELQDYFRIKRHQENSLIQRAGELCSEVHFIGRGRVRLRSRIEARGEALVDLLGPGDFFGNLSVHSAIRGAESAYVDAGSEIWTLDAATFQTLLGARSKFAQEVCQAQHERVCHQRQRMSRLTTRDVPSRLMWALVDLCERFGVPHPTTGAIALSGMTQQDLAEYIGSVRTFVSSIVGDLKRSGIVTLIGHTLHVQNRCRLYELAEVELPEAVDSNR